MCSRVRRRNRLRGDATMCVGLAIGALVIWIGYCAIPT